jgi:hypothetical protein
MSLIAFDLKFLPIANSFRKRGQIQPRFAKPFDFEVLMPLI